MDLGTSITRTLFLKQIGSWMKVTRLLRVRLAPQPTNVQMSLATNDYRSGAGAHWTFLSDPGRKVQKDLDIAEYTDPQHDPMIPHVIVVEPGLVIFKIYNGYWFFGRPTIEELRQDLRAVLKKCRPDWDITTPELKSAWEEGKRNRFYPYDKTFAQVFRDGRGF